MHSRKFFFCRIGICNKKISSYSGAYFYRRTHRLQAGPMEWHTLTSRIAEAIFSWITRTSYPFQYVWSLYQYHKYVFTVVCKAFGLFFCVYVVCFFVFISSSWICNHQLKLFFWHYVPFRLWINWQKIVMDKFLKPSLKWLVSNCTDLSVVKDYLIEVTSHCT